MISWIGHFANGIADTLFVPFILATVVCAVVGVISWVQRDHGSTTPKYGSLEYSNPTWRMWAAAQGVGIMWIVYAVLSSVPPPDYKTVRVKVPVVQTIAAKYGDAYAKCKESVSLYAFDDHKVDPLAGQHEYCDAKALDFIDMTPQIVTKTVIKTKTVETLAPEEKRYQALFNTCMGGDLHKNGWGIRVSSENEKKLGKSTEDMRNERIKLCHTNAKDVLVP